MVSRVPISLVASERMLFLFCIKPNSFLTFSLASPSSDLKADLKVPSVLSCNSFLLKLIGLESGSNLQLYVQMNRT